MKIIIFTSNALRHRYVANTLAEGTNEALIISECKTSDASSGKEQTLIEEHFAERYAVEKEFFGAHTAFRAPTLPILMGEANSEAVMNAVRDYKPDMGFVFGSGILKEPLLALIPSGKFINMHLGLSPYYRGSGTNFWPFMNEELEYVGATLLHIDPGIDTGDIVAHARPTIEGNDTVHTLGNKTIIAGTKVLLECLKRVQKGEGLPRVKQWPVEGEKYYKTKDFSDDTVLAYRKKIAEGVVARHLEKPPKELRLVSLP